MNNTRTIDLFDEESTSEASISVLWHESYERHSKKIFNLPQIAQAACLSLFLTASPFAAIADPWSIERRRRDAVITMPIYQEIIGRFILRTEALRISRQILEQAERERLVVANLEAAWGIQWGMNDDL